MWLINNGDTNLDWNKNDMYINGGKIAYFLSCLITEYWEFEEAKDLYFSMLNSPDDHSDDELNKQLLELKYEIIDQFHFLMNMLIYGRISLDFLKGWDLKEEFLRSKEYESNSEDKSICTFMSSLGEYLNKFPYKTWKKQRYTQEQLNTLPNEIEKYVVNILRSFFNFVQYWIEDEKEFWSLYYTKNLENIERQNNNNKGYIK